MTKTAKSQKMRKNERNPFKRLQLHLFLYRIKSDEKHSFQAQSGC